MYTAHIDRQIYTLTSDVLTVLGRTARGHSQVDPGWTHIKQFKGLTQGDQRAQATKSLTSRICAKDLSRAELRGQWSRFGLVGADR